MRESKNVCTVRQASMADGRTVLVCRICGEHDREFQSRVIRLDLSKA